MGTRHQQIAINKAGERKLSQYGQWDGYPEGQGIGILRYLKSGKLDKYEENLSKLREVTQDELDNDVNKSKSWQDDFPYLSRDCGSKIHQMIEDGEVRFIQLIDDTEANQWCEGFYTIDFSKNEFTSSFHGSSATFPLDNLPTEEEYLAAFHSEEDEEE